MSIRLLRSWQERVQGKTNKPTTSSIYFPSAIKILKSFETTLSISSLFDFQHSMLMVVLMMQLI